MHINPAPANVLSFALLLVLAAVQQSQSRNTFHQASCGVAEESAARLESPVDPDVVLRRHKEVARLGRVVRGLLGNIVSTRAIRIVPVAGKGFAKNGVQRLLHSSVWLTSDCDRDKKTVRATYGGLMCHPLK